MHHQAKMIVSICARQEKTGDPKISLLVDYMEVPLRELVGGEHWIWGPTAICDTTCLSPCRLASTSSADARSNYSTKM